jgi:peptidyl-dipeptidase Dcp
MGPVVDQALFHPLPHGDRDVKILSSFFSLSLLVLMTAIAAAENPFFVEWTTPFGVPPFDQIQLEHYRPAFDAAMKKHAEEVRAIFIRRSAPTFENTIAELDRSGAQLDRVSNVFFSMKSSMNNEGMEALAKYIAPLLSKHADELRLNDLLFQRVKAVYEARDKADLNPEQKKLLEETYKMFVRGGANLSPEKKERLKEINSRLSVLSVKFGENVLKEENKFQLVIDQESDLEGLPDTVIAGAAEAAAERGLQGKWVFLLNKPSLIPFLQYSARRDLRAKIYEAYIERGNHGDELDNKALLAEMVKLRVERSKLLGYETHAHYVLEENMAKVPDNVYKLLREIWTPAVGRAKEEVAEMQAMIKQEGGDFPLAASDWWYYAEKVKKAKYDLDEEMLRPYFKLENVRQGAFDLATRLWGLKFIERKDIPVYHPDVTAFEVQEADGTHVGILYVDYFPRASKRGGAWMSELRQQFKLDGKDTRPVVYNVGNFSKPTGDKPSLMSLEEVETLFHEFGHGLHGLLSNCTYKSLAGTNVARDFVELPSQIMENWATEPQMLKLYARHYQSGEPIPDELIEKIQKAQHFNQGFATTEYLAASFLDMDWHTVASAEADLEALQFERASMDKIGLISEIVPRYRSTYFNHIFAGEYASGYYAYLWAEVLDADAFKAFSETGDIFNPQVAKSFRDNILSRGGTEQPMELYRHFRGKEPGTDALLERRGLK